MRPDVITNLTMTGLLAAVAVGSVASCTTTGAEDGAPESGVDSGGGDVVDAGDGWDGEAGDGADDGGVVTGSGPLTFVATELSALTERMCDLDDDGVLDNAIADLGGTSAGIFAATLTSTLSGFIAERGERYVLHLPHVERWAGPTDLDCTLVTVWGADLDGDDSDDFSGVEPFTPAAETLDECGEPRFVFERARIERGELTAEAGVLPVVTIAPGRGAELTAVIDADLQGIRGDFCTYFLIDELGPGRKFTNAGGLTTLEMFLAGGAGFGLSEVPGLTPDVDLDGDGLERLELDDELHLARCVDGDGTVIDGADCWADPRMADAISVTFHFEGVPAGLRGVEGLLRPPSCGEAGSLWGVCPYSELRECVPGETRPCSVTGCESALQQCAWGCAGWGSCWTRTVEALTACDSMRLLRDTSCGGDPPSVTVIDGAEQVGGVRTVEDVAVPRGGLRIVGTVTARANDTSLPSNGFSVSAMVDPFDNWTATVWWEAGVDYRQPGYSLRWLYHTGFPVDGNDDDEIALSAIEPGGLHFPTYAVPPRSAMLDASTEGEVTQGLVLQIVPDLPETEHNEMQVLGYYFADELLGSIAPYCSGSACIHQLQPGDVVGVGLTAGSLGSNLTVEAAVGDSPGVEVELLDLCP